LNQETLPVLIDHFMSKEGFNRVRCVYYRVEAAGGPGAWPHSRTDGADSNLAAWSDWAILTGPDPAVSTGALFESPDVIDGTFERLEKSEERFLDLAHIWLPAEVFDAGSGSEPVRKGDVYRISIPLFSQCYRFSTGAMSEEEWLEACRSLAGDLRPSPRETEAFRSWRKQEISHARTLYHSDEYAGRRLRKRGEKK
jgi:hypothetical protein